MDDTLSARAQKLKGRRDALMIELASVRRSKEMPIAALSAAHVEAFGVALRSRLQEGSGSFQKRYLQQFVSDIRYDGKRVTMSGRKDALLVAAAQKEMGTARVPTSGLSWLPDLGSNQGHIGLQKTSAYMFRHGLDVLSVKLEFCCQFCCQSPRNQNGLAPRES